MKIVDQPVPGLYEAVFDATTSSCLLLKPDAPKFTILKANQSFTDATLSKEETLIGRGVFEAFPDNPDDPTADGVEKWTASLLHVLEHREIHEMDIQRYAVPRPAEEGGGFEEKYWQPANIPVFNPDGTIRFILHQVAEVTNQIAAEIDRNRFFDVASDVLVKVGLDGYFKEINPACEAVLGWTQEEMTSRPWLDFIHPDDVAMSLGAQRTLMAGTTRLNTENRYLCKDGSYRWLSWHTRMEVADKMVYCAATDITQTRRLWSVAEGQKEALEMSVRGEPLTQILERLILTMDENTASGAKTSIMLMTEDRQHLTVGAAPRLPPEYNAAINGMPIGPGMGSCGMAAWSGKSYVAHDIETDPNWQRARRLAKRNDLRACMSTPLLSSTGEVLGTFALYHAKPTSPTNDLLQLTEIISRTAATVIERERNMVSKRLAQQQLIQARNEAEAANRSKSEFLANMSHEMRTPMNVVVGVANIMAKYENLSDTQLEMVQTLQNSADALLDLINDLLDISKIETQNIELERVPFSITRLMQEISDMMSVRAAQNGLRFRASGECTNHDVLLGDPTRLRQVILNLCSNALKFTQEGTVAIQLSCSPAAQDGFVDVSIAVSDTGIGIDERQLSAIFRSFTQADSSIDRKFGGTGLGLAITKRLVEMMDGNITVESVLGEGSTFTVTVQLPYSKVGTLEQGSDVTSQTHVQAPVNEQKKVLLVEDFEPNALIAARYLKIFGYSYDIARNGLQAVEKAQSGDYLAILMDVQMPEMNGLQATRQIRIHEQATEKHPTPIIAMTAYALAGDRERCLDAGMDDYLSKPIDAEGLREKLQALSFVQ
ncbi:PAS domain S-box-containing protein [Lewinella aquimaris]|uniref:Sensory/regulatory protein RpfC n=1 Tax=Neolewinella aquimaris TaxID=1835722 RepID=A0A840E9E5_9BACT|nr:ATP-binding protein [Neolewinella aquimaris]MBB4080563.1 PAS domain S-box-containing protein [Neolewinella aquimaris]